MSRVMTPPLTRLGTNEVSNRLPVIDLSRLRPLWRHVVAAVALFAVCAFHVHVGRAAQQARVGLVNTTWALERAQMRGERLDLEILTRTRELELEGVGGQLGMSSKVDVKRLRGSP